jgi:branched-chain amino acid transport system permease protein
VLVVGFLIHRFEHSRLGRASSAVFVDKDLATSFGVDIKKLGRLLQVFSSTVAGGCGVIYGFLYRSFHLDFFTFQLVGLFMTIIFVGGYATMWGVVVAAPLLYGLTLLFPPEVASWRIVIYGAILVAVLVLKPEGFITRRLILNLERLLSSKRKKI